MSSSNSSDEICLGNTKTKQISPAVRWCFTLNNWTEEEYSEIIKISSNSSKYYIVGKEIGEEGTPHLQGYIEFKKKCRPLERITNKRIHWEKAKGNKLSNFEYCSKDGDYCINGQTVKPLKLITDLYDWQQKIVDIAKEEPDDRIINWIHENKGNRGKSSLCKLLCAKYNAIILGGKGADMKYGIVKYIEKHGTPPKIIIVDLPRSFNHNFICYPSLEDIKNGCFFSGKYEADMVLFNSPHIFIFSNEEPDYGQLSEDRWNVVAI